MPNSLKQIEPFIPMNVDWKECWYWFYRGQRCAKHYGMVIELPFAMPANLSYRYSFYAGWNEVKTGRAI